MHPHPCAHGCAPPTGRITLQDLKRCKLANVFFDTFFNIEKYLDHEQKEQASLLRVRGGDGGGRWGMCGGGGTERLLGDTAPCSACRPQESDSEGPELSDWERFAAEEYDILVAEEAAGDPWEDG